MKRGKIIAVAGGIGSGKSVVCRMLAVMGYAVYDCDSRARVLMDADAQIKCQIKESVCAGAVGDDGVINRAVLSACVFGNEELLGRLNSIVHGAVISDFRQWAANRGVCFVETAILYQSGLDRLVDEVWEVSAPVEVRLERVMRRNGLSADEVMKRIAVQDGYVAERCHRRVVKIINDGTTPLLPQIESLLS